MIKDGLATSDITMKTYFNFAQIRLTDISQLLVSVKQGIHFFFLLFFVSSFTNKFLLERLKKIVDPERGRRATQQYFLTENN